MAEGVTAATVAEGVKQIMRDTFPRHQREVQTARVHLVPDRVPQEYIPVMALGRTERFLDAVDRGLSTEQRARARSLDGSPPLDAAASFFGKTRAAAQLARRGCAGSAGTGDVAEAHGWVPQSERAAQGSRLCGGPRAAAGRGGRDGAHTHVIDSDFSPQLRNGCFDHAPDDTSRLWKRSIMAEGPSRALTCSPSP